MRICPTSWLARRSDRLLASARALIAASVAALAALALPAGPAGAAPHGISARLAAALGPAADIYVSNSSQAGCSDSGSGTEAQPFCTITAAAAAVQPGQTVVVEPGYYTGTVTITRSGTAAAPITFLAADNRSGIAFTESGKTGTDAFDVSGAQHIRISGFFATGVGGAHAYLVDNSSDITIEGGTADVAGAVPTGPPTIIQVTGTSSDVAVRDVNIRGRGPGVQIDAGVTGASVVSDIVQGYQGGPGVLVTDAPGSIVTGNTLVTNCGPGIVLAGASAGASVQNNIIETGSTDAQLTQPPAACATPADATALSVSAASAPQTTADYNLIDPVSGGTLYSWDGSSYADPGSFTAVTGQGAHDIAASPDLGPTQGTNLSYVPLAATSPAIDSANASAPGEPATDLLGNARADDPGVADSGTGIGYYDRGAVELQGPVSFGAQSLAPRPGGGPFDVTAAAQITTSWTTSGPVGTYAYLFSGATDFVGDQPVETTATSADHTYRQAGSNCVTIYESSTDFRGNQWTSASRCLLLGADFTAVAPDRVLDTSVGIGAPAGPVGPGGNVVLAVPDVGGVPAADVSAVVANITVTSVKAAGGLGVYPDSAAVPQPPAVRFTAGHAATGLVSVALPDGKIVFHNGSKGTVQVAADVTGFYGAGGGGFKPLVTKRVLDTRKGTGGVPAKPVPAHGVLRLSLGSKLPAGADAAVLTVSAIAPKSGGGLMVYPDGQRRPAAASLRFSTGSSAANQVIVPLTGGSTDFYNSSGTAVQVVADLAGYYGSAASGATARYVPQLPQLIGGTSGGTSSAVAAHGTVTRPGICSCASPLAWVWTVTVTKPEAAGSLTAYPQGKARPNAWNLLFASSQAAADLVTVPEGPGGVTMYNGSAGPADVSVDEDGYFTGPP